MNKQALSRKLRAAGVSDDIIASVFKIKAKTVKLPREMTKRLGEVLAEDGRAVAVLRGKRFTVFGYDGYMRRIAAVTKHVHLAQAGRRKEPENG